MTAAARKPLLMEAIHDSAASDYIDCMTDHSYAQADPVVKVLSKARNQAIVMEIDQPKIDVLAAAEAYYKARSGTYALGKEAWTMEKLYLAMQKAFGPKP